MAFYEFSAHKSAEGQVMFGHLKESREEGKLLASFLLLLGIERESLEC